MNTILNREHFEISRSDEYFNAKELQAQTGQPSYKFGEVVLKELIDAEKVGINEKSLNDLVSASDVAEYISGQKSSGQPELFQPELYKSKSSHLAEISRAPVQSWLPLATLPNR